MKSPKASKTTQSPAASTAPPPAPPPAAQDTKTATPKVAKVAKKKALPKPSASIKAFVTMHRIVPLPHGNPNRDGTGQPKSFSLYGVTRSCVSSQSQKKAYLDNQEGCDPYGVEALMDRPMSNSKRSRLHGRVLYTELRDHGVPVERAVTTTLLVMNVLRGAADTDKSKDKKPAEEAAVGAPAADTEGAPAATAAPPAAPPKETKAAKGKKKGEPKETDHLLELEATIETLQAKPNLTPAEKQQLKHAEDRLIIEIESVVSTKEVLSITTEETNVLITLAKTFATEPLTREDKAALSKKEEGPITAEYPYELPAKKGAQWILMQWGRIKPGCGANDILWGRTCLGSMRDNTRGAVGVSFAIGIMDYDHALSVDYGTTVDVLATSKGAGHIAQFPYLSDVFYQHSSVDLHLLAENLENADIAYARIPEVAGALVHYYVMAVSRVFPRKRITATNTNALSALVLCEMGSGTPITYSDAFEVPINQNVFEGAYKALVDHMGAMDTAHPRNVDRTYFVVRHRNKAEAALETLKAAKVPSDIALADALRAKVVAFLAPYYGVTVASSSTKAAE